MTPGEEYIIFYHEIGIAITQWAHVENSLFQVVAACFSDHDRASLALAFFSVENFRSKLQLADNVFCRKFKNTAHFADWGSLHKRVRTASSARNSLAHHWVLNYPNARPGRRCGLLPRLGSARSNPPKRPQEIPPGSLFVRDIAQLAQQFSKLGFALQNFGARLHGKPEPIPKSLEQEEHPPTLEHLRRQIHAMFGHPQRSSGG